MGFLKKLIKGAARVATKVSKGISVVAGFAGKVLPAPLGTVATAASKVTGFASKLTNGLNKASKFVDRVSTPKMPDVVFDKGKDSSGFNVVKRKRSLFFKPN